MRLRDRIALVFGAGSSGPGWGNGKAAAVAYAREGARVVAVDLLVEAAEETAAIIRQEGGAALAIAVDTTNLAAVEAAGAATISTYSRIDILHNNVGVVVQGGPVELDEPTFQRNMDINLG